MSGFTFGAKTTGTPAFGTGTLTFGSGTGTQPSLSFGGTGAVSSQPNFGFGTSTTTTQPNLSFGTPAPASQPNLSFGTPATTQPTLSFGTPAVSQPLSFGPATSTPQFSFGSNVSAPATTISGLLGQTQAKPLFGATTTVATATTGPTLSFGSSIATTSTPINFGLGTSVSAAPSFSLGAATPSFGLGGVAATTSATTTTQPAPVGLGGIATATKTTTTTKEIAPKEQLLPNEILQTVEQFKRVLQEQKVQSSELTRSSIKEFRNVEAELDALNVAFNQVETQLLNDRNVVEKLKYDTAKGLQNIEMAQRTQDTPPGLQFDNTAPLQYFMELAENFEKEMQILKTKIDTTEKYIKKYNSPTVLTSQDLVDGLKRLHETFVALAGRLHTLHHQVEAQKEFYLNWRRQNTKDDTNPFEQHPNKNTEAINTIINNVLKTNLPNLSIGPTPFNNMALGSNNLTIQQNQPTTTQPTLLPPSYYNYTPTFGNTNTSFQLQKPPTGNKRGKQ